MHWARNVKKEKARRKGGGRQAGTLAAPVSCRTHLESRAPRIGFRLLYKEPFMWL